MRKGEVKQMGLTVIELVLVIIIVGLLAGVTVPRFEAFYSIDLASAARTLAADIRYAQSQAIAERTRYGIIFDPAAEAYTVYRNTPATPALDPLAPGRIMKRRLRGVDLIAASFDGGTAVEFDGLGVPYAASGAELVQRGRVLLAEGGISDTVAIYPLTGRVEF